MLVYVRYTLNPSRHAASYRERSAENRVGGTGIIPQEPFEEPQYGMNPRLSPRVIKRKDSLRLLDASSNAQSQEEDRRRRFALTSTGGTGTSQVCLKIAENNSARYDLVRQEVIVDMI